MSGASLPVSRFRDWWENDIQSLQGYIAFNLFFPLIDLVGEFAKVLPCFFLAQILGEINSDRFLHLYPARPVQPQRLRDVIVSKAQRVIPLFGLILDYALSYFSKQRVECGSIRFYAADSICPVIDTCGQTISVSLRSSHRYIFSLKTAVGKGNRSISAAKYFALEAIGIFWSDSPATISMGIEIFLSAEAGNAGPSAGAIAKTERMRESR
jgi:hypothetical protein